MMNKFYLSRRRKPPLELILIGLNALHPPLIVTLWLSILMNLDQTILFDLNLSFFDNLIVRGGEI